MPEQDSNPTKKASCQRCDSTGLITLYDRVEYWGAMCSMPTAELCPECLEQSKCPKCLADNGEDWLWDEGQPCLSCGHIVDVL